MKLFIEDNETFPAIYVEPDSTTTLTGFTHSTKVSDWDKYRSMIDKDYLYVRDEITKLTTSVGFNNMPSEDKDIVIAYHSKDNNKTDADNDTDKVVYLMGTGKTQGQAVSFLKTAFANHHVLSLESCKLRGNSIKLSEVVLSYLNEEDATDFTETAKSLFDFFMDHARKGSNDYSKRDGLFDFIESTSSYLTMGLEQQGYTLVTGTTWAQFRIDLMDVLRHGNY